MASLWAPSLSSQFGSMSASLPHRKCVVALRDGEVLRRNSRLSCAPLRRFGSSCCPSLVVRASAVDAAMALSKVGSLPSFTYGIGGVHFSMQLL
jgi:hypothetical protein